MKKPESKTKCLFFGGMKHCGKTTHGKRYAQRKGFDFNDLDHLIEKLNYQQTENQASCREIYIRDGKEGFQQIETQALIKWLNQHQQKFDSNQLMGAVLSLGGGIGSNAEAMELISESGIFIYIKQKESVLFDRILYKGLPPFLKTENPKQSFHALFTERTPEYEKSANLMIEPGDKPQEETAQIIFEHIESYLTDL